jgi:ATP-dependent DNA helicase RecG
VEEGRERLVITLHIEDHDPAKHQEKHQEHAEKRQEKHEEENQEHEKHEERLSGLSPRSHSILAAVSGEPLTRAEVFERIGLHSDSRAHARHLTPLIEAGLVAMTEPDTPRVRTQRYAITDAGRALLDSFR